MRRAQAPTMGLAATGPPRRLDWGRRGAPRV